MKTIKQAKKELSEYTYMLKPGTDIFKLEYTQVQELVELFQLMEIMSGRSYKYSDVSYAEKLCYKY